jgi:flagellar motor switch protein FliM
LRAERRLSVFENKVLRRIFGPWRDGVRRGWRKLHNKEIVIIKFYSSDQIENEIR